MEGIIIIILITFVILSVTGNTRNPNSWKTEKLLFILYELIMASMFVILSMFVFVVVEALIEIFN